MKLKDLSLLYLFTRGKIKGSNKSDQVSILNKNTNLNEKNLLLLYKYVKWYLKIRELYVKSNILTMTSYFL